MARRTGAPGAKTERAWRHCGSGLRVWRGLGLFQCAWRHLELFFSALGAISGWLALLAPLWVALALGTSRHNLFIKSFKLYSNFFWGHVFWDVAMLPGLWSLGDGTIMVRHCVCHDAMTLFISPKKNARAPKSKVKGV